MLSKEEIQEKEECIRELVGDLSADRKLMFFKETEKKLKDPDTYATLNFIFIAGLHHFYLGKWGRGLINIVIFGIGAILLLLGYIGIGVIIILVISIFELYALFKSQTIVQAHNNGVMEEIYQNILQQENAAVSKIDIS